MKQILYFFAGAASGLFVGFLVTSNHYEELLEQEREGFREYCKDHEDEPEVNRIEESKAVINKEYFTHSSLDEEPIVDEELDIRYEDFPTEDIADRPYLITMDQYLEDFHGFDKDFLLYWSGNDCLVTETEDEKLDIDMVIGRDSLKAFEDGDTIWVRNERLGTDYEVKIEMTDYISYEEEVTDDEET